MPRYLLGLLTGILVSLVLLVVVAGIVLPGSTVSAAGGIRGGGEIGEIRRIFQFRNDQNNWRRMTIRRNDIVIPDYGTLVEITTDVAGTNLWFMSEEGVLRNVMLGPDLYEIRNVDSIWKEE